MSDKKRISIQDSLRKITAWTGSLPAIIIGNGILFSWLILGMFIGFNENYQLIGNTFMSAVSYILLFIIQNSVNRDSVALHLKLDELIRSKRHADDTLINIENLSDDEFKELQARYAKLAEQRCAKK